MKKHFSSIHRSVTTTVLTATAVLGLTVPAMAAFVSGSACAVPTDPKCLGAFTSSVASQVIDLPPDGILNYTTFTVQSGHTVSFKKNAANTPVTILTSGNVSIAGSIWVSYTTNPTPSGTAGDGVLGDDGQPGTGGPGGFDGGNGAIGPVLGGADGGAGGAGKGPGGGQTTAGRHSSGFGYGGGGGGFNGSGSVADWTSGTGGNTYGQWSLLPLIGGSGGAGGSAGATFSGGGGAGGGGAILIASSGTIYISGYIYADGGTGARSDGTYCGGPGGGGSGGAIRLVAEKLDRGGAGYLYARGGGGAGSCYLSSGSGANGYVRLESNVITNWSTGYSTPGYSYTLPSKVFVPSNPTLAITAVTVGGSTQAVPANPTGVADVTLPQGTTTASVQLAGTNIPVGTTITVYVMPTVGATRTSVLSTAMTGASDAATTATATVTLSNGNNVLLASATYTVTELLAMNLPKFGGEYVAKIRVDSDMAGASKVTYITASGKEYPADGKVVKAAS
jgi:hypothetical protein